MLKKIMAIPLLIFGVTANAFAETDYLAACQADVQNAVAAKRQENANRMSDFKNSLNTLASGMSATQSCVSNITNMGLNGSFSMPFDQMVNMVISQVDQQVSKVCNQAYSSLSSGLSKATGNFGGTVKIGTGSVNYGFSIKSGQTSGPFSLKGATNALFNAGNSSLFGN